MIDYLPFFMILLASALNQITHKIIKGILVLIVFFTIILNQIQTYQYRYNVIHYKNMNKDMYWDNFMRIDRLL